MKKILIAVTFSMQLAMSIFAQNTSPNGSLAFNNRRMIGRSEIKINAMRDFTKRFADAVNATWSRNEDRLRAKFSREGILYMVDYDKKGRWVSTIRVYDENNLKSDLRKIVKSNYIDYSIVKAIEVTIGKSHVHFIKMENATSLLTLHIMNGEITEMENYKKG